MDVKNIANGLADVSTQATAQTRALQETKSSTSANELSNEIENANQEAYEEGELSENLQDVVGELNQQIKELNTDIKFGFNDDINGMYITVFETENNEVIRKIPSDEAMELIVKMKELVGMIFDKKG